MDLPVINLEKLKKPKEQLDLTANLRLKESFDLNQIFSFRNAVLSEDLAIIDKLLLIGYDPNQLDPYGYRPLHYALWLNNLELIAHLVSYGADTYATANNILTPMQFVLLTGDHLALTSILSNLPNQDDYAQHVKSVQYLLINDQRQLAKAFFDFDPKIADFFEYGRLHQAAESNNVEQLLAAIAVTDNINIQDKFGFTPLHLAVINQDLPAVKLLVAHGATIDIKNKTGNTPFDLAVLNNFNEGIYFLLQELSAALELPQLTEVGLADVLSDLKLQAELEPNQPVQFKLLLEQHGYGSQISDLTLNFKQVPQGIDFTGCDFKRVTFLGELKFSIFDGYLEQVNFNQVNLYASNFNSETVLNKVKIQNSNFSYVVFEQAFLNETYFYYVDLSETIFNQAIILNSFASGSNFTDTTVNQSVVKHFIINNSILPTADNSYFQLSEIVPKRGPSIGILSSYQEIEMEANLGMSSASPYARIKQFGAIPVLLDFYALGFNETQLNLEVQDILNNLMLASETDALPLTIAQAVLQANTPTVASIKTYAEITMQSLDALWLPGGPDVAAEFYGHASQEAPNYLREVVEFALIEQAYFQEKPIIGVCHGSQIINVYFGGTLLEDVPGHWGVIQSLNPLQTQGILGEKIEGEILGVSVHHQAVGELADIFEPVLEYDGIIKASQTQSGSPILLFQFHPEYGLDENNLALLETFFDLASSPSVAPKLGDVLALNDIFADTVIPNGAPGLEPILPLDTESVEYLAPPTLNYPMLETEYIIYI